MKLCMESTPYLKRIFMILVSKKRGLRVFLKSSLKFDSKGYDFDSSFDDHSKSLKRVMKFIIHTSFTM